MKNPRAFTAQAIIGVTAALCAGGFAFAAATVGPVVAEVPITGAAADLPPAEYGTNPWDGSDKKSEFDFYEQAWKDMNLALQKKDRDLFLSHAEGDALQQLALWWDNMEAIGFTTGYVLPTGNQVSIGVDLGFPANELRGSNTADAGLILPFGQDYEVTTEERDDDIVITSFRQIGAPMPWDEGELYVAKRDHAIVYGLADERSLVDSSADSAEAAASKLLEMATQLGSTVPQKGFISAVTAQEERLQRWHATSEGLTEISGFARAAFQPSAPSSIMDPRLASGGRIGGTSVVLGPSAFSEGPDYTGAVFIHEFAHALHNSALTTRDGTTRIAPFEGFARWVEWQSGYGQFTPSDALKQHVAALGAGAFANEVIDNNNTASLGYQAAGSYYMFVAQNGGDPWALAIDAARSFESLDRVATTQNPAFDVAAWQQWMAGQ